MKKTNFNMMLAILTYGLALALLNACQKSDSTPAKDAPVCIAEESACMPAEISAETADARIKELKLYLEKKADLIIEIDSEYSQRDGVVYTLENLRKGLDNGKIDSTLLPKNIELANYNSWSISSEERETWLYNKLILDAQCSVEIEEKCDSPLYINKVITLVDDVHVLSKKTGFEISLSLSTDASFERTKEFLAAVDSAPTKILQNLSAKGISTLSATNGHRRTGHILSVDVTDFAELDFYADETSDRRSILEQLQNVPAERK